MKPHLIPFLLLFVVLGLQAQPPIEHASPPILKHEICLNSEEVKLYELLMEHRSKYNLPPIPLSLNLSWVAQAHGFDLQENNPANKECNMHSWSDQGPWLACCYADGHENDPHCMWDKPSEFTEYKGAGYEIVFRYWPVIGQVSLAENALKGWKGSPGHNNIILNEGLFTEAQWKAMGIGIVGGYVIVWFGEQTDGDGPPPICEKN